jgi:hypothetical protein
MIEMVMVHELAHCKQMNHSKAFWKARDTYAVDLRALWARGYTGEGMWGRGRGLDTGNLQTSQVDFGDVPEHLCGGTYGRKSKKRRRGGKEKETLSYAEKKQRRILKKFGAGGQSLGADDETKVKLEGGIPKKGKPRVANSARGRDLRAAAALARFEPVKKEEEIIKKEEISSESETEDEYEGTDQTDAALDIDGTKLVDDKGRALVKICEDEDDKDGNARREMDEIQDIAPQQKPALELSRHKLAAPRSDSKSGVTAATQPPSESSGRIGSSARIVHLDEVWKRRSETAVECAPKESGVKSFSERGTCNVCSLLNEPGSLICAACSNVLNPHLVPNYWKCGRESCKQTVYINAGDAGICGLCAKPKSA